VWAGAVLEGEAGDRAAAAAAETPDGVDAAARRYVGGASSRSATERRGERSSSSQSSQQEQQQQQQQQGVGSNGDGDCDDDDDDCCICQEGLADARVQEQLGEPLTTTCGHRFHAVCYARLMEASSESDPLCPMCRSGNLTVRFLEMPQP
jgi:hypothetical protein